MSSEKFKTFYSVIRRQSDISQGIFPEHQKMSPNKIFLWDTYQDLLIFPESDFDRVEVKVPAAFVVSSVVKSVGAAYFAPYLKNIWEIQINPVPPRFVE